MSDGSTYRPMLSGLVVCLSTADRPIILIRYQTSQSREVHETDAQFGRRKRNFIS